MIYQIKIGVTNQTDTPLRTYDVNLEQLEILTRFANQRKNELLETIYIIMIVNL